MRSLKIKDPSDGELLGTLKIADGVPNDEILAAGKAALEKLLAKKSLRTVAVVTETSPEATRRVKCGVCGDVFDANEFPEHINGVEAPRIEKAQRAQARLLQ